MTYSHYDVHIHGTVTVGAKGQVVIPKAARDEINISEGDHLMVMTKGGIAVGFIKADDLESALAYMQTEVTKKKGKIA